MGFPFFGKKPPSEPAPVRPAKKPFRAGGGDPLRPTVTGLSPFFHDLPAGRFGRRGEAKDGAEGPSTSMGPMTQAAFTQMPSELDIGDSPRRSAPRSAKDIPEVLEQCALAYASGQSTDALRMLNSAIDSAALGSWAAHAWHMRFDLLMETGDRETFEALGRDYAAVFERTPPEWTRQSTSTTERSDMPAVRIAGQLSSQSAAPLSALRKTVELYAGVRLDFERLASVDAEGCRHLLLTVQVLRRGGKRVGYAGEDRLLRMIRPLAQPGDKSRDPAAWLLLFDVLQFQKRRDDFVRTAFDYALTYEVAAPQWEEESAETITVAPVETLANADWFVIEGDLVAPIEKVLARIAIHADKHPSLVIDMTRARRVDFVAASQLSASLAEIAKRGRTIEIRSPSEMVAVLLMLMGVPDCARIVPRR